MKPPTGDQNVSGVDRLGKDIAAALDGAKTLLTKQD